MDNSSSAYNFKIKIMNVSFNTINQLILETTSKYSDLPALSLKTGFRTKTYTYREVYDYIRRFPGFFSKHGIKNGDKIVVLSLNRPEYSLLILGALICGVTIVPIDYRTNRETIVKFIKTTQAKAVFTTTFFEIQFHNIHHKIYFFEELLEELEKYEMDVLPQQDPTQLAALLFTSGTTGEPKGTMITYNNILASINNIRQVFLLPVGFRILSILPLSHALEMFGGFLVTYTLGCHIHYIERINSITIVQALKRYRIQGMAVVPQMLRILLQNVERRLEEDKKEKQWENGQKIALFLPFKLRRLLFSKLHESLGGQFELFVSGSAPLETKLAQTWINIGIHVLEGYGASETTGFVSTNSLKSNRLGTVGKIMPGIDYQKTDEGELLVSGGNIVSGYFENPEKTAESFPDGKFHTGDIVKIDRDGYLRIVGRDKFKIVLADGKKVYPEDVEKRLNNNPQVVDSTVFGIPTDEGEIVHAELILKNPHQLKQIIDNVNKKLNPHEQITDFGTWPQDDFPRNKTLKVDREAVREEVMQRKNGEHKNHQGEEDKKDKIVDLLKIVSGKKNIPINSGTNLATDLKLDSLKRIELLAFIEEELGVSVDELEITSQTTVADLRKLVQNGKPVIIEDGEKLGNWQFTQKMDITRVVLQESLIFPLFNIGFKIKIIHPENLLYLKAPQLFIFNHVGVYDVVNVLRVLPREVRKKLAIAATAELWHEEAYHRYFSEILANVFPFVKAESHGAMRGNFDRVGQLLDMGYSIMISPEGNITHTGELLPFHTGAGYIAVEMGVPVVPFKINGYYQLWPEKTERKLNLFWPENFGEVEVVIGEPITFERNTSYEDATNLLREAVINLK